MRKKLGPPAGLLHHSDKSLYELATRTQVALPKINQKLKQLVQLLCDLESSLYTKEEAEVLIFGKVYPGTRIFVKGRPFIVQEEMSGVRFTSKSSGLAQSIRS